MLKAVTRQASNRLQRKQPRQITGVITLLAVYAAAWVRATSWHVTPFEFESERLMNENGIKPTSTLPSQIIFPYHTYHE